MTPRAPVVISCSRKGGKLSCVTRPHAVLNPYKLGSHLSAATAAARTGKDLDTKTKQIIAAEMGNIYEKKYNDDLGSVAMEAVLKTLHLFDPKRGKNFLQYARFIADNAVKNAMAKEARAMGRKRGAYTKWREWVHKFTARNTREHNSLQELTAFINEIETPKVPYTVEDIRKYRDDAAGKSTLSLDAPTGGEGEDDDSASNLYDLIAAADMSPEEEVKKGEVKAAVQAVAQTFTEMQQAVYESMQRGLTNRQIAEELGDSPATIAKYRRQVEAILQSSAQTMAHKESP